MFVFPLPHVMHCHLLRCWPVTCWFTFDVDTVTRCVVPLRYHCCWLLVFRPLLIAIPHVPLLLIAIHRYIGCVVVGPFVVVYWLYRYCCYCCCCSICWWFDLLFDSRCWFVVNLVIVTLLLICWYLLLLLTLFIVDLLYDCCTLLMVLLPLNWRLRCCCTLTHCCFMPLLRYSIIVGDHLLIIYCWLLLLTLFIGDWLIVVIDDWPLIYLLFICYYCCSDSIIDICCVWLIYWCSVYDHWITVTHLLLVTLLICCCVLLLLAAVVDRLHWRLFVVDRWLLLLPTIVAIIGLAFNAIYWWLPVLPILLFQFRCCYVWCHCCYRWYWWRYHYVVPHYVTLITFRWVVLTDDWICCYLWICYWFWCLRHLLPFVVPVVDVVDSVAFPVEPRYRWPIWLRWRFGTWRLPTICCWRLLMPGTLLIDCRLLLIVMQVIVVWVLIYPLYPCWVVIVDWPILTTLLLLFPLFVIPHYRNCWPLWCSLLLLPVRCCWLPVTRFPTTCWFHAFPTLEYIHYWYIWYIVIPIDTLTVIVTCSIVIHCWYYCWRDYDIVIYSYLHCYSLTFIIYCDYNPLTHCCDYWLVFILIHYWHYCWGPVVARLVFASACLESARCCAPRASFLCCSAAPPLFLLTRCTHRTLCLRACAPRSARLL